MLQEYPLHVCAQVTKKGRTPFLVADALMPLVSLCLFALNAPYGHKGIGGIENESGKMHPLRLFPALAYFCEDGDVAQFAKELLIPHASASLVHVQTDGH